MVECGIRSCTGAVAKGQSIDVLRNYRMYSLMCCEDVIAGFGVEDLEITRYTFQTVLRNYIDLYYVFHILHMY